MKLILVVSIGCMVLISDFDILTIMTKFKIFFLSFNWLNAIFEYESLLMKIKKNGIIVGFKN